VRRLLLLVPSERQLGSVEDARICRRGGVFTPVRLVEEEPLRGATWQYSLVAGAVVALSLSEGAIDMVESHEDSQDSHDESSAESPIRGKDEEPTEAHGGDESEQEGGSGAGPEGADREDTREHGTAKAEGE